MSNNCNDNSIIGCARYYEAALYTNDVAMQVKAKMLGINTISVVAEDEQYTKDMLDILSILTNIISFGVTKKITLRGIILINIL